MTHGLALLALAPFLLCALGIYALVAAPLPGRGPGIQSRDVWRSFRFEVRRAVMARAGGRCEAPAFFLWGRCAAPAVEADHVYPWSKGGATTESNGQALCHRHNRSKSNLTPPWWYLLGLERRRARYFPAGVAVRVSAAMCAAEQQARTEWSARRTGRG